MQQRTLAACPGSLAHAVTPACCLRKISASRSAATLRMLFSQEKRLRAQARISARHSGETRPFRTMASMKLRAPTRRFHIPAGLSEPNVLATAVDANTRFPMASASRTLF